MISKVDLIKAAIFNDRTVERSLVRAINSFNGNAYDDFAIICAFAVDVAPMVRKCYSWAKVTDMEVLEGVVAIVNEVEE